ncbi:MAG: spermidine synthase [archaeon]
MKNIKSKYGGISSVYPCTKYLTFGPWIYIVPQYKPESVLILGYAGGTTAGLIKLFYGEVPITGVDIDIEQAPNWYDVNLIEADAKEYVKDCPNFDTIIIDIYDKKEEPPDFVFSKEFVKNIEEKANYIILDATKNSDISNYSHLNKVKTLKLNKNRFHYFMVNRISSLPIR